MAQALTKSQETRGPRHRIDTPETDLGLPNPAWNGTMRRQPLAACMQPAVDSRKLHLKALDLAFYFMEGE